MTGPGPPATAGRGVRVLRRAGLGLLVAAVALVGAGVGVALLGSEQARIGPVEARLAVRADPAGGSRVDVPPLGAIRFASHAGPLALRASVLELRPEVARALARDPAGFRALGDRVGTDLRRALTGLALRALAGALLGAGVLCLVAFRSVRLTVAGLAVVVVAAGGAGAAAALTASATSLREPRYTGLLASAPTAVGDAREMVQNFSAYRRSLGQLVSNVVELYDVTSALPTYRPGSGTVALLHVSDLHLNPAGVDLMRSLIRQFDVRAVLDSGDVTDHGTAAESGFVRSLGSLGVPYLVAPGNHDSDLTRRALRALPRVTVLDDRVAEVAGIRVAGVADPRFTPDKSAADPDPQAPAAAGERLAATVRDQLAFVSVALVHDPATAAPLAGLVPLTLAGHTHARRSTVQDGTLHLVEGSTGGAGLRGLEPDTPTPLEATVLYLDPQTQRLQAWDAVTLGGLGTTSVTVERHLPPSGAGADLPRSLPAGPPSPAGTP